MSNGANQHYFLIYFFPKSKLCVQRNKQILQNKCCSKCLESDLLHCTSKNKLPIKRSLGLPQMTQYITY